MIRMERFNTRELILLGVFNALLLCCFWGTIVVLHLMPLLWAGMDPIVNFVLAPIFCVMLIKVPKIGVMTIHGIIIGITHAAAGWWPGFVAGLVAGVLADGVSKALGGYKKQHVFWAAILVFATAKAFIFYAPVYLLCNVSWFQEVISAWPRDYIEKFTFYYVMALLFANFLTCSLGIALGSRIVHKHFKNTSVYQS